MDTCCPETNLTQVGTWRKSTASAPLAGLGLFLGAEGKPKKPGKDSVFGGHVSGVATPPHGIFEGQVGCKPKRGLTDHVPYHTKVIRNPRYLGTLGN